MGNERQRQRKKSKRFHAKEMRDKKKLKSKVDKAPDKGISPDFDSGSSIRWGHYYASETEAVDVLSSAVKRIQPSDLMKVVSQVLPGWRLVEDSSPGEKEQVEILQELPQDLPEEKEHALEDVEDQKSESGDESRNERQNQKEGAKHLDYVPDQGESSSSPSEMSDYDEDWEEKRQKRKETRPVTFTAITQQKDKGGKKKLHEVESRRAKGRKTECEYCGKFVLSLDRHMKVHRDKNYLCPHCGETFKYPRRFQGHVRTHTGDLFRCDQCPKTYKIKRSLILHLRHCHTEEAEHSCTLCPTTFLEARKLKRHVRAVHMKIRDHLCPECGKTFGSRGGLIRHRLLHSGKRECQCDLCSATFTNNWNLKVHKRSHESNPDFLKNKEWFSCPRCHVRCGNKKGLETHLKSHM